MPELPEVAALADDLSRRLGVTEGEPRAIAAAYPAAISALKTYDPPVSALSGLLVDGVTRHGKFLDIDAGGLHLIIHLARAGWLRWKDEQPKAPPRPGGGKNPLAFRVVLDDGSGFDLTEAGTKKGLAVYLVRDPAEVPGIARLGPEPLDGAFTRDALRDILTAAGRAQIKGVLRDQSQIAGIGNAYSDEILHVAKMSPFKPANTIAGSEEDLTILYEAIGSTLRDAIARSDGLAASELKREKKSGMRVHARTGETCEVCGDTIREVSFADSSLQYCPTCQTGGKPLADRRMSKLLR
ncbi:MULTISPECIES: Fpg/Nei family DNA glycosylase [Mumia]|uniref:Fpg/Nei family DNA glycosylase n=1 Tax=Mumia TaxID=1546255 RepID=UPI0014204D6E|nr:MULTISPECIES: Fpg/Nei family DNA glycosylase [unclassified Mumia]QMW66505.1 Fpg/Nei family DNA glycosylase [Mumia sp. ZJ1417]